MGGLLLATLLLIDPRSARVDVSGGVAVEARIGRAPVTPVQDPELSFLTIVTPDVAMEVRARRSGTFTLGYSPRVQYRLPNRLQLQRPIFLHTITSTYDASLSRRWLLGVNLGTSVGEIDYTGINIALGDNTAVPDVTVINFVFGNAGITLTHLISPTQRLIFGPSFDIRAPIASTRDLSNSAVFDNIPTPPLMASWGA
jgi:hypothetical protein